MGALREGRGLAECDREVRFWLTMQVAKNGGGEGQSAQEMEVFSQRARSSPRTFETSPEAEKFLRRLDRHGFPNRSFPGSCETSQEGEKFLRRRGRL